MSRMRDFMNVGTLRALFVSALVFGLVQAALADDHPVWWDDALHEGEMGHYEVLDYEAMRHAVDNHNALLLDVRPDYEFERGHIPGAANFEFHPGHAMDFPKERREAFKELAGPDKDRTIIIYCRSFR